MTARVENFGRNECSDCRFESRGVRVGGKIHTAGSPECDGCLQLKVRLHPCRAYLHIDDFEEWNRRFRDMQRYGAAHQTIYEGVDNG